MNIELKVALANAISAATGSAFEILSEQSVGGGCINEAAILFGRQQSYFVKLNQPATLSMFTAEAEALEAIDQTDTIKVPRPITHGLANGRAYLILEAILFGIGNPENWRQTGEQLASLHRHSANQFGWHRDNTIGSSPQRNTQTDCWNRFFREQRLRPQFELAKRNGYSFARADALLDQIDTILEGHHPEISLLHGDLWSGNAGFTVDGTPVLYDPASYYGDRETDLAFSEFFGGFPPAFYTGYHASWPLDAGYQSRKELYNLYHVLNHANLFGSTYVSQAQSLIHQLLA